MKPSPKAASSLQEYRVEEDSPLLDFLIKNSPGRSRTTVKSWLTHRQVTVNNQIVTLNSARLAPGDVVCVATGRGPEPFRHPMMRIVFEDDHLIVIDKRNGLLSMGTDKEQQKTAYYLLSEHVKRTDPRARIFILHRLDRETSGLMVFAKSERVQEAMQKNWKRMVVMRRYVAVAEGVFARDEGVIRAPLADNRARTVYVARAGEGEDAVTGFRVLARGRNHTLVELELETGRKNQIRAHLQYIGHPVAGDVKYGGHPTPAGRVCLHAYKLHLIHPVTSARLDFETRIPQLFEKTAMK